MSRLLIPFDAAHATPAHALAGLAAHFGIAAELLEIPAPDAARSLIESALPPAGGAVALPADLLAAGATDTRSGGLLATLDRPGLHALVYGWRDQPGHQPFARQLGGLTIHPGDPGSSAPVRFSFPPAAAPWVRQLAGLGFAAPAGPQPAVFRPDGSASRTCHPLLLAGPDPVLVHLAGDRAGWFCWTGEPLADPASPLAPGDDLPPFYQTLLPAVVFLRAACGTACWHNPRPAARLTIDDPLLTPRYGFLRYSDFLDSLQQTPSGMTIAFIPYNHARSRRRVVEMFKGHAQQLSLCVHGCDHTKWEFSPADPAVVTARAARAIGRMRRHQDLTGLPFDPVMIFPQGRFSTAALAGLRQSGYLAAVNTSPWPQDAAHGTLLLGDLLLPAANRLHGFPVFRRHYPRDLFDFAADLFLGRPALVVEHHEYFRGGMDAWIDFARRLNALDQLAWPPLAELLETCCWQRQPAAGETELLFFTPRFRWQNRGHETVRLRLAKPEPGPARVARVTLDGRDVPFTVAHGRLLLAAELAPGATLEVAIHDHPAAPPPPWRPALKQRTAIFLRRRLTEVRDNWLSRHDRLRISAHRAMRALRLTADSPAATPPRPNDPRT